MFGQAAGTAALFIPFPDPINKKAEQSRSSTATTVRAQCEHIFLPRKRGSSNLPLVSTAADF
jgi:hypothetical protein